MLNTVKSRFLSTEKIIYLLIIVHCTLNIEHCFAQWVQVSNGMGNLTVNTLTFSGNNIFAGTGVYSGGQGVYLSINNGENWTQTALNNRTVSALAVNGNYIFAATFNAAPNNDVFLSTNNGTNWAPASLTTLPITSLTVNGNYIFAGLYNIGGVYKSTNNGANWSQTSLNNGSVIALAASGNYVFASYSGTGGYGVYKSTDNGVTWTQTSLTPKGYDALAINGNNIYAGDGWPGTYTGVYKSTDHGENWTQTSLNNRDINTITLSGNYIFAGTNTYGVFISSDNGASWILGNEGLGNLNVYEFIIFNNFIYAGTGGGVYRRPLGEITGINLSSNQNPKEFLLFQNYPNPFNPSTSIKFDIPKASFVKLAVYDVSGNEVAVLINDIKKAGTYSAEFDGSSLSSGVYFYKLITSDFTETKRMILLK